MFGKSHFNAQPEASESYRRALVKKIITMKKVILIVAAVTAIYWTIGWITANNAVKMVNAAQERKTCVMAEVMKEAHMH